MRALQRAIRTADEIDNAARARALVRPAAQPAATAALTEDLDRLYDAFRGDKRALYQTGLVPEGSDFRGHTWRPRRT